MTAILGLSAYYHDSAAALLIDGRIVAAAQEERFTRKKQDESFPALAIKYCLSQADLTAADLDYVAFYEKPLLKFDRLLETYLAIAPHGFWSFTKAIPLWLKKKLFLASDLRKGLGSQFKRRFIYPEHHESHAASAFFPSPYEEAAVLTIDGVGEWATASYGVGRGNRIELTHELKFPHSLGMLYSAFTYYCGFKVNSGEYKLMGLAPYGDPQFVDLIFDRLLDLRDDGSFQMDMSYFNYTRGLTMTSAKFHRLFGRDPRRPESPLTQLDMDLAASVQAATERIVLNMGRHLHQQTGLSKLCLAGGVALNCVANGRLLREGPFEDIWIQPAAGDAGGALGAAMFVWHQMLGKDRPLSDEDQQRGSYLGPEFSEAEIAAFITENQAIARRLDEPDLLAQTAQLLAEDNVVGWFQGRMEYGPRALGNRSILGDARSRTMQSKMNLKIKFRESFRPFAPSVLLDKTPEYFDFQPPHASPYMLLVADVSEQQRTQSKQPSARKGLDRLNDIRSSIPAITHVDCSARLQTVDGRHNPLYHQLLETVEKKTGCPVVINTSFNVRGEPIVCTPADAYHCFMATNMDVLVLGPYLLLKDEQPEATQHEIDEYLAKFELD